MSEQKNDSASLLCGDSLASPATTEPLPKEEPCEWCDGMGADVDAEAVQTGAHSVSWVGSITRCNHCNGSGVKTQVEDK